MLSVIDAMKASTGFTRPMREGEELLRNGMIVSIGKKSKENNIVHVQSLVLRTSGIGSKDPAVVEIWIDVLKDYGERVVKDNEEDFRKLCDCPAGSSGKCKHIIAVMLGLAGLDEGELEDISCTDLEQQWGTLKKTTLQEFEAKPLSDLCHVKGQRDIYVKNMPIITSDMEEKWRRSLMNSQPLSEYSLFWSCLRQGQGVACCEDDIASLRAEKMSLLKMLLTFRSWHALGVVRQMTLSKLASLAPDLVDFYDRHVVTTLDQSLSIICAEQGTDLWKISRKLRITASKARAQYTYYKNKKANWDARYKELYHSSFSGNDHTVRGLVDEVLCREKYEEQYSCKVLESGLCVRPEIPWLAASLDGTMLDDQNNFVRNLEVKSFKEGLRLTSDELLSMNAISTIDENGNVKKNTQHYAQMQLGMLLTGISECWYLLWSKVDSNFCYREVVFDEGYVLELCSRLVNVYFEKFLPRMMAEYGNGDQSEQSDQE